jgi:hypothetical protein
MYTPTDPHEWGLGGVRPADWEGPDTEPFKADPAPDALAEEEIDWEPPRPPRLPGSCVITCVTPAWKPRKGLVVKHGAGWIENSRCPCCGLRAVIEIRQPVQDCADCGGSGHVFHEAEAPRKEPGAFRMAIRQAREQLRMHPKEDASLTFKPLIT